MKRQIRLNPSRWIVLACGMMLFTNVSYSQQQITVNVSPTISKPIKGVKNLNRSKYFNLSTSCSQLNSKIDQTKFNYYINDLEMTVGRNLGMIHPEVAWGNSIREDANRPGFVDVSYLASQLNPNNNGIEEYMTAFGARSGMAMHERIGNLPSFFPTYTKDGGTHKFPTNNDAHAELAANLMKHRYTDFQRPEYYELVNEPPWQVWGDQRFFDMHTKTKAKFDQMNIPTEVGGPCYSISNFYKNNFNNLGQITGFIDNTNFSLDFYSFHSYDYMSWNDAKQDFTGAVTSGLPHEAVFDAMAAHTVNAYGKEFSFVGSEHGGYISSGGAAALDMLANKYFPGTGFLHELEKRSIEGFLGVNSAITNTLMYMNNPHIVKKVVPFILLESASWNPEYMPCLLVKENFDKNSNVWHESKYIHFYNFFDDVKGRRVKSICNDADIQHQSFVDGNKLIMLFHNQSNVLGEIDVNLDQAGLSIQSMMIRRIGRNNDFRPYYTEGNLSSLNNIQIKDQESIAIFITFTATVPEQDVIDEIPYYSTTTKQIFTGSKNFTVNVPDYNQAQFATLRVGIGRQSSAASAKNVTIKLNGTTLNAPIEDCADRITSGTDYATTRIINIDPSLLKATNTVNVNFTNGQQGGVGAVVIRAGIGTSTQVSVTGVTLAPTALDLQVGQTGQLAETVSPSNATNKSVAWSSSNNNVATVSNSGLVTAISIGPATITVTTQDGGYTATCNVSVSQTGGTLPAPWQSSDIGAVAAMGNAGYSNGTFTVQGSGADIWGTADEFRYVYQSYSNDVEITAKVNSLTNTNAWAKVGVMIRSDLTAGSPWAATVITPSNGVNQQYRINANSNCGFTKIAGQNAPIWLRARKEGNSISSYYSTDGTNWTQIGTGQTIPMGSSFYVGMCVTSHNDGVLCTTGISDVSVTPLSGHIPVTGVSIAPTTLNLQVGQTGQLTETISPLNATNKVVSWSSSNTNIATTSSNGLVTAVSAGQATITATTQDGGFTATCNVSVTSGVVSSISFANAPTSVPTGEDVVVDVNYVATTQLEVAAIVNGPTGTWLANDKQTVAAGTGSATLTVSQGTGWTVANYYKLGIAIRPVGGGFNDSLDYESTSFDVVSSNCAVPFTSNGVTCEKQTVNWTTGAIDISCASAVDISLSASGTGSMENADYMNIYYKINGGANVTILENVNTYTAQTLSVNNVSGNTLEIIVQAYTSYTDEVYTISNISVTEGLKSGNAILSNAEEGVFVFPNPFTDNITLELPEEHLYTMIHLIDISGRKVLSQEITNKSIVELDKPELSNADNGIYFIQLIGEHSGKTIKIVKVEN